MSRAKEHCRMCARVEALRRPDPPRVIYEFAHSFFLIGDHQFHRGYSLLIAKEHVRELHELEPVVRRALFDELMEATEAIVRSFSPWKMNHACYGNQDEHVHWHLFPRYEEDPDHRTHPWVHAAEFAEHAVEDQAARQIAARVRASFGAESRQDIESRRISS